MVFAKLFNSKGFAVYGTIYNHGLSIKIRRRPLAKP
jgi:hypothetical protein